MAYERKRGKLAALNALLLTGTQDGFSLVVGDTAVLSDVRYVITLDTDTQLPRDAARQFVGAMAHPLNRPYYDPAKRRVTAGYGILQPRVAVSLPGTNRSRYARLYGGEPGIDPYTRVASDVYQDVFGEGSFIGKGIYDVDAFEQALGARFPENRILSHDLLEGCYARAGLLSDVQLYEDYPARYSADVSRRHRWIRGDWQLAGWLLRLSRVPGEGARRRKNPLSVLSQWKLIDNLRRSLVPAALTLLLLLGWTALSSAWSWTLSVLGIMLLAPCCAAILELFRKPDEVLLRQHLAAVASSAARHLMQVVFELRVSPVRGVLQSGCDRAHALAHAGHAPATARMESVERCRTRCGQATAAATPRRLVAGDVDRPALASAAASHLALSTPAMLAGGGADPAPVVRLTAVRLVDQPPAGAPRGGPERRADPFPARAGASHLGVLRHLRRPGRPLAAAGQLSRSIASPRSPIGPRRPTSAWRCWRIFRPTTSAISRPANWSSARPIPCAPCTRCSDIAATSTTGTTRRRCSRCRRLYISTVDSGNLAGHLLTLRAGLLALADDRILMRAAVRRPGRHPQDSRRRRRRRARRRRPLAAFRKELEAASAAPPATLTAARSQLARLASAAAEIASRIAASLADLPVTAPRAKRQGWAQALARQCQAALDELNFLAPWLALPPPPIGLAAQLAQVDSPPSMPSRPCANWRVWMPRCCLASPRCSIIRRRPATAPLARRSAAAVRSRQCTCQRTPGEHRTSGAGIRRFRAHGV